MKETILLYNLDSAAIRNKIKFLCIQGGIHIRVVEKNQYDVPIGTLAFGKKKISNHIFALRTQKKSLLLMTRCWCLPDLPDRSLTSF